MRADPEQGAGVSADQRRAMAHEVTGRIVDSTTGGAAMPPRHQPNRPRSWLRRAALTVLLALVGAAGYLIVARTVLGGNSEVAAGGQQEADPAAAAESDGAATGDDVAESAAEDSDSTDPDNGQQGASSTAGIAPLYVAPELEVDPEIGYETDGNDHLGRPIPALPDVLVTNTPSAQARPGYYLNPADAPSSGPFTLIEGGVFYLRGTVSSENVRQRLITTSLAVLPADAVVIEYEIDPTELWFIGDPYPVLLEDDVLFEPGSTEVNEAFVALMEIGANLLAIRPDSGIRLTGHSDSQGTEQLNLELSRERAEAVKAIYRSFGTPEHQIIVVAKGESEPVADNDTKHGRQANRRVEFELVSLENVDAEGEDT